MKQRHFLSFDFKAERAPINTYNFTFEKAKHRHPPKHQHPVDHLGKVVDALRAARAPPSLAPLLSLPLGPVPPPQTLPRQLCRPPEPPAAPTTHLLTHLPPLPAQANTADKSDCKAPTHRCQAKSSSVIALKLTPVQVKPKYF